VPKGDDGHALHDVARDGNHHGKRAGHGREEMGRRRELTRERELARGFAILGLVGPQHRCRSGDEDGFRRMQGPGRRTQRQGDFPALHAARLVQAPQHVVERHEVGGAVVHGRQADDRPSGLPAPLDLSVPGAQAVEEPILRAEIEPVAADEDLVRGAAEPPLPDRRARVDAHGDDAGVAAREVDVLAAERRTRVGDRAHVAAPQ